MRYARLAALFAVTAALALAAGCGDDDDCGGSGDAVKAPEGPKAMTELGWKPRFPKLTDIVRTAWEWHRAHPNGYAD